MFEGSNGLRRFTSFRGARRVNILFDSGGGSYSGGNCRPAVVTYVSEGGAVVHPQLENVGLHLDVEDAETQTDEDENGDQRRATGPRRSSPPVVREGVLQAQLDAAEHCAGFLSPGNNNPATTTTTTTTTTQLWSRFRRGLRGCEPRRRSTLASRKLDNLRATAPSPCSSAHVPLSRVWQREKFFYNTTTECDIGNETPGI